MALRLSDYFVQTIAELWIHQNHFESDKITSLPRSIYVNYLKIFPKK